MIGQYDEMAQIWTKVPVANRMHICTCGRIIFKGDPYIRRSKNLRTASEPKYVNVGKHCMKCVLDKIKDTIWKGK